MVSHSQFFDMSKVIREVVYVESDLDTDEDGKPDLLQVTVFRPYQSNNFKFLLSIRQIHTLAELLLMKNETTM